MNLKNALGVIAVSVAAVAATPASAVVFTLNGSLSATDPVFNRPLAGTPPTSLSAVGTAVRYDRFSFTVSAGGAYAFLMNSGTGGFDTFLGLYSGSFNPASPLTNVLQYNDDFTGLTTSGFTQALTTGTTYIAVLTSFNNNELGNYSLTIDGSGTVTPGVGVVPEPATWAMMMAGIGAVGFAMRRRQKVTTRVQFA